MPAAEGAAQPRAGNSAGELALTLYRAAGAVGEPAAQLFLDWRGRRGKEAEGRRGERFGRASQARPPGALIWVHAASVGETVAALPLIERLARRVPSVLLTTGTVTAAKVAASRLPPTAIHQFAPIDTPGSIGRFLQHWRPGLVLFAESELWPTTLAAVDGLGIPLGVFNARMSDRSFRLWRRVRPVSAAMLGRIDFCLAQSLADSERLRDLGAGRVVVCGNLKFDSPPPPADPSELARLQTATEGRLVLLAASTHPGEEERLVAAYARLRAVAPSLLIILAPRHPQRGDELAKALARAGLAFVRRSEGRAPAVSTEVLLADTIGEMGLWYRLADLAFLGGSIVSRGGQNPIEAARLHVPIVHGAHIGNFRDVYAALGEARATKLIADDSLVPVLRALLIDPVERERMAREAFACVERMTGALDRTMAALLPYLARLDGHATTDRA